MGSRAQSCDPSSPPLPWDPACFLPSMSDLAFPVCSHTTTTQPHTLPVPSTEACGVCLWPTACAGFSGEDASPRGQPVTSAPPAVSSAPPTIWGSNETSEVTVMEGHAARFLCEARGVPTPDIVWFKDRAPLPPSPEAVYTRGGRQLQLASVQGSDAGVYTCKASNPAGVTEKATRLEVYGERRGRRQHERDPGPLLSLKASEGWPLAALRGEQEAIPGEGSSQVSVFLRAENPRSRGRAWVGVAQSQV